MIIWKDKYGDFQVVQFNSTRGIKGGEVFEILNVHFEGNALSVKSRFKSTNHVTTSKYIILNEYFMQAQISGDANTTINYKKLK